MPVATSYLKQLRAIAITRTTVPGTPVAGSESCRGLPVSHETATPRLEIAPRSLLIADEMAPPSRTLYITGSFSAKARYLAPATVLVANSGERDDEYFGWCSTRSMQAATPIRGKGRRYTWNGVQESTSSEKNMR